MSWQAWSLAAPRLQGKPPEIFEAASTAARAIFVDAHNTGYYINASTAKLNPTMDTVLRRLLEGVRRLQSQWESGRAQAPSAEGGAPAALEGEARTAEGAAAAIPTRLSSGEAWRRTMQVLSRFETSFRRASWKSGSELLFPILSRASRGAASLSDNPEVCGPLTLAVLSRWGGRLPMRHSLRPTRWVRQRR